jgi:type I restriction enzyme S subunit
MDVKPGYKQTDVGVIPDDWEVKQIGEFNPFVTSGSRGWAAFYSDHGSPFIRITNLSRRRIILDLTDLRLVSAVDSNREAARTQLKDDDILISITADIGIIGYVTADITKPAYINQHIALVRFNTTQINPRFVSYFLASETPQRNFGALKDIGAKSGMNLTTVQKISLALPPSRSEQDTIATALSDADTYIESLEQLIAKKRLIKQGVMQELLTGRRRLPGFSGEWVLKQLGDVTHIKTGGRNNEDKVEEGLYPFFVRSEIIERINSYSHDCEAILVPGEGRIGSIFHYIHGRFDVHQRVYAITQFNLNISGRYIYFYLTKNFGVWAMQNTVKATVDSLRLPTFTTFEMLLPPTLDEQEAIAEVLGEMDAEIVILKSKLEKARQLKQGMIQELLTGKIRLI